MMKQTNQQRWKFFVYFFAGVSSILLFGERVHADGGRKIDIEKSVEARARNAPQASQQACAEATSDFYREVMDHTCPDNGQKILLSGPDQNPSTISGYFLNTYTCNVVGTVSCLHPRK